MIPGNVVIRTHIDGDARSYEILEADPLIEVSAGILETGMLNPGLAHLNGDVLTISARNRTLVYRVKPESYDPFKRTYLAEWPD